MTVLVLGLDGLDHSRMEKFDTEYLPAPPSPLRQDLDGNNALYTWRVWPSIFAGVDNGADEHPYRDYEPEKPFVWESYGSRVMLAPVSRPVFSQHQDSFPDEWMESYRPRERLEGSLTRLREGIISGMDNYDLIVACTRVLDIAGHHLPDEADALHEFVLEEWLPEILEVSEPDGLLIVSDHGFGEYGKKGIEAHTRNATLCSTFCDYDTMSGFIEGWRSDLADEIRREQMAALGYRE